MKFKLITLFLAAMSPIATSASTELPSIEDFVRHAQYGTAKISPNGKYIAITVDRGGQDILVVLNASDLSILKANQLPENKSVGAYYWSSPERLILTSTQKVGSFSAPFSTGEWYAVNADGSKPRSLIYYGVRARTERGKNISNNERFSMLDPRSGSDNQALMQVTSPMSKEGVKTEAVLVDTSTGRRKTLARAPRENCQFALDKDRQPTFVVCMDSKDTEGNFAEHSELYQREADGGWKLLNSSHTDGKRLTVLGSSVGGTIYATLDDQKGPAAVGVLSPDTGEFTTLFQDPISDPAGYIISPVSEEILGVVTEAGKPKVTLISDNTADIALYNSLIQAFPNDHVNFANATDDGEKIIISVYSDVNPGTLYLFNRKDGSARFLMQNRDWINPEQMSAMQDFSFTTRDGLKMHGYITFPKGKDPKNLPLIVNPHGGPIGPRDDWGFNPITQLFASRGYAVMQVNFRGSGGFGQAFMDMGHRQWGGTMQDDLTDATRWAIEQGYADPKRICLFGGSYGGYASVMGAAKEPELYACAVGYVGMYDVQIQLRESDTSRSKMGQRYFARTFGTSRAEQDKASPINYVDRIKAPIFLAAGARDERCPPEHTEALAAALTRVGNPPEEVIIQEGEMHGFYKPENNANLYRKMLTFFDRHIGEKAAL